MCAQRVNGVCIFFKWPKNKIHIGRIGFFILRSSVTDFPSETSEAMIGSPIVCNLFRRLVCKEFGVRINWGRGDRIYLHGLAILHWWWFFILYSTLVEVVKNSFDISAGPLERSGFRGTLIIFHIHNVAQISAPAILTMLLTGSLGRHQPMDGVGSCWLCSFDDFWLIQRVHRQFPLPHRILRGLRRRSLAICLKFSRLLWYYRLERWGLSVLDKVGWGGHILDHAHYWDFRPFRYLRNIHNACSSICCIIFLTRVSLGLHRYFSLRIIHVLPELSKNLLLLLFHLL